MIWRPLACAMGLALMLTAPAQGQSRSDRFVDLMAMLPEGSFAAGTQVTPAFADLQAARVVLRHMVEQGRIASDSYLFGRVSPAPFRGVKMPGDWARTVGFAPDNVLAVALTDAPLANSMAVQLVPGATSAIGRALLANGYSADDSRGFPAWWRLARDGAEDASLRNPDDPFAVKVPLSSRITIDGDVMLQSVTWPGLQAMMAQTDPGPVLMTMGAVLDAPEWGDRSLIRATALSDPAMVAPRLNVTAEMTKAQRDALQTRPKVPYWSNLLLADLSNGDSDLTLLMLIYATKVDAETAAKVMADHLGPTVLQDFGGVTVQEALGTAQVLVMGNGPFAAAVVAVETAPKAKAGSSTVRNQGYHVLTAALFGGALGLLAP